MNFSKLVVVNNRQSNVNFESNHCTAWKQIINPRKYSLKRSQKKNDKDVCHFNIRIHKIKLMELFY